MQPAEAFVEKLRLGAHVRPYRLTASQHNETTVVPDMSSGPSIVSYQKGALMRVIAMCAALLFCASNFVSAGEVTLDGAHLCCGACVKAIQETLKDAEGITELTVDKDSRKIAFNATNAKAARKGVVALTRAGFAGKATHAGKEMKLPKGYQEDTKSDSVTLRGLHNCCGGCAKAITTALKKVDGVKNVDCKKKSATVSGEEIAVSKLIAALHEAGLHARVPAKKKAE